MKTQAVIWLQPTRKISTHSGAGVTKVLLRDRLKPPNINTAHTVQTVYLHQMLGIHSTVVNSKTISSNSAITNSLLCGKIHVCLLPSMGQDGRRPPAVSSEQPSPAVCAPVQWMGTGRGMHIKKHPCAALAAAMTKSRLNCTDVNYITKAFACRAGKRDRDRGA